MFWQLFYLQMTGCPVGIKIFRYRVAKLRRVSPFYHNAIVPGS